MPENRICPSHESIQRNWRRTDEPAPNRLTLLQINVGRKCNQACRHCHADAAPWRTEMIGKETAYRVGEGF